MFWNPSQAPAKATPVATLDCGSTHERYKRSMCIRWLRNWTAPTRLERTPAKPCGTPHLSLISAIFHPNLPFDHHPHRSLGKKANWSNPAFLSLERRRHHDKANDSHCLVNWPTVCQPKDLGGLRDNWSHLIQLGAITALALAGWIAIDKPWVHTITLLFNFPPSTKRTACCSMLPPSFTLEMAKNPCSGTIARDGETPKKSSAKPIRVGKKENKTVQ